MLNLIPTPLLLIAQTINYNALPQRPANQALLEQIINFVLGVAGGIAVIMVVIGGIQYASSQGDPQSTSRAKQTILSAIVGLVLAIFARVIIGVVFGRIA